MRSIAIWLILVVALSSAATWAAPTTAAAPGSPNALFGQGPDPVPDVEVAAGAHVADLLHHLQHLAPDFQYVAEPGPWQNTELPEMRLRGVTLPQVVEMLTNLVPDLRVANIPGTHNSLYVFSGRNRSAPGQARTELNAFGLADPVERFALRYALTDASNGAPTPEQIAAGRKKALEQVLSLLQSAATQADPSSKPTLKLHEETMVLLVRGTVPQLNAITQSINALGSSVSTQAQVDRISRANQSMAKNILQLEAENAALKAQLQKASAKTGTDEKH